MSNDIENKIPETAKAAEVKMSPEMTAAHKKMIAAADEVELDFAEICRKRIEKMGGRELFAAKETKQKALAALMRYGFSYDDIKEALKIK